MDARGPETMGEVQEKLGVNKDYFRQWRTKTLRVQSLLLALDLLDIPAGEFFCSAMIDHPKAYKPGKIAKILEGKEK